MKKAKNFLRVRDRMSVDPATVGPKDSLQKVIGLLRRRAIRSVPVIENGRLIGIVSLSDLAALANEEANKLGSSLDFFTRVVRAQSSQHNLPKDTASHKPPALPVPDSVDTNNRSEILDAGGPG